MKNLSRIARWLALAGLMSFGSAQAIDVTGWTCSTPGSCGTSTADGDVTNAPVAGSTGYAWVSTDGANAFPHANLPGGIANTSRVTNGATYRSGPLTLAAGEGLSFYFNYVTSEGTSSYTDFGWARLLDSSGNQVALLFTARTHPTHSVVPGVDMPAPQATLTPASVPITSKAPDWSPLGGSSGDCFRGLGNGCGFSGWVHAQYTVAAAGTYHLEVGVVNWVDTDYNTGLAVDGLVVGAPPAALTLNQPATGPVGTTPTYQGTVTNPGSATTVDLQITGPGGYTETLQATLQPSGTYSITGAALPTAGTYTVVATLTGSTLTATRTFNITAAPVAVLTLDQPATGPVGTTPTYQGTVTNPGTATTVDLQITGPNGYAETLQAPLQPGGTYSITGAALPTAGTYTVVATLTGSAVSATRSFIITGTAPVAPADPQAVPTTSGGVLMLMGLLMSALVARATRRRRQ